MDFRWPAHTVARCASTRSRRREHTEVLAEGSVA